MYPEFPNLTLELSKRTVAHNLPNRMYLNRDNQRRLLRLAFAVGKATRNCTCGACRELEGIAPAVFTLLPPESDE